MEVFEEIYQGAFRPDFEKRGKAYEAVSEKLREKIQAFSAGLTDDQWRLLDEIMTLSADLESLRAEELFRQGLQMGLRLGFSCRDEEQPQAAPRPSP